MHIYLDNNATTKPLDGVVEAMLPFLGPEYANPSSVHRFGQRVRHGLECAREQVAGLMNAEPREIVFTSGGTESINLAIRGVLAAEPASANHPANPRKACPAEYRFPDHPSSDDSRRSKLCRRTASCRVPWILPLGRRSQSLSSPRARFIRSRGGARPHTTWRVHRISKFRHHRHKPLAVEITARHHGTAILQIHVC